MANTSTTLSTVHKELSTGFKYFSLYCTRVRQFYHDHINYAFSLAHTIIPGKVDNSQDASFPRPSEFELGIDLLYKDRNRNNETVIYKGAPANSAHHTVQKQD
eukprot:11068858-Ditylum_brightwellii.AAC.1